MVDTGTYRDGQARWDIGSSVLLLWHIWIISNALNFAYFLTTNLRYHWSKGSLALPFPLIWETTNWESFRSLMHSVRIYPVGMIPMMIASYSAWLSVVGNSNL